MEKSNYRWLEWAKALFVVLFAVILYRAVQASGWLGSVNIQTAAMTSGVAFLVGLVASVSSCLAVVGGVVVAFSEKVKSGEKNFFEGAVRPNVYFHIGRLLSFFFLGGLLGAIGGKINLSGSFVSAYSMIIAIVMAWLGLNILGILPSISSLGLQPPKFFRKFFYRLQESGSQAAPFLLGGFTFFLPCGFTQSMQILALASGSFWAGAASLFFFALGTLPVLLALGVGFSWGKFKKTEALQKAAGILVIFFAVFTFNSALALRNVKTNVISSSDKKEKTADGKTENNNADAEEQTIEMAVTSRGFEPSTLKIKKGVPVRWIVNGVSVSGCTNSIIIPSLNIAKNIHFGENIISFVPSNASEIPFSCGMGMVRGKFIIE